MVTGHPAIVGFMPFPCDDCNASGRELAEDHDEHGPYAVVIQCEGCGGDGQLRECANCRVVMPAGEIYCEGCRNGC